MLPPHHHRIASTSPPCCHHIATALPLHHCNTCSQHCLQQWLLHVLVLVSMPKFLLLFTTSPCWVQISAIKALLGDLRGGLSKVNTEILKAAGVDANSAFAHRQFGDLMMSFHQHAKSTFSDAEVCSTIPPPPPHLPDPSLLKKVVISLKLLAQFCCCITTNTWFGSGVLKKRNRGSLQSCTHALHFSEHWLCPFSESIAHYLLMGYCQILQAITLTAIQSCSALKASSCLLLADMCEIKQLVLSGMQDLLCCMCCPTILLLLGTKSHLSGARPLIRSGQYNCCVLDNHMVMLCSTQCTTQSTL